MNVIADTNTFLAVALGEPERDWIIEVSAEYSLVAPAVLPYEIGNALSAMIKRKQVTKQEALTAEKYANLIPVRLVPVDIQAALGLAIKHSIYAYDAYFLLAAQSLSHPILTLDKRMKAVARDLSLTVLEQ